MINYYQILIENPRYFKQFSCKDLLFLNYDCPVKENKVAKWSEHHYIYYVLSGQKILHTPEKSWRLTKGTAVFVKKGACVVEQFFREPFCIVVFVMPDSFIRKFIQANDHLLRRQAAPVSPGLVIEIDADQLLKAFYDSVLPYFGSEKNPPEELIELKFTELLIHILSNPNNGRLIDYLRSLTSQKCAPIEEVMEANFAYNLSLENYATLCNRSLSSFKRDFQAAFKTSPGKWLLEKKLARAQFLITTTSKPVAEIALDSGFENNTHFSRVFKQKFGKSPAHFRKEAEMHVQN